jgi:hypothetical protein
VKNKQIVLSFDTKTFLLMGANLYTPQLRLEYSIGSPLIYFRNEKNSISEPIGL